MNKTIKTLLIIGGIIGIAFITKKYWYKTKSIGVPKTPTLEKNVASNPVSFPANVQPK
jgi:hypothetical protein